MTTKNFGTGASPYLDPDGRAWESVAFVSGRPVLDSELNLLQDVAASRHLRHVMPSGWLSDDFLGPSDSVSAIFTPIAEAGSIQIPNLVAHVNGWVVRVQNTRIQGANKLSVDGVALGSTNGWQRTDMVVLEVYRRLVQESAAGLAYDGKSGTGLIYREGNVLVDPASDAALNYPDDTISLKPDPSAPAVATARRIQVQYRLRVIYGVDLMANPYGMTDANLKVLAAATGPNAPYGAPTSFKYQNQSANGDPGLWRAGDGDPVNALGTADGYIYALPLLGIFRRNTAKFDRLVNQNGGAKKATNVSDRPDGLFSDVVDARDIIDLRSAVSPTGWDAAEVLSKATVSVLDNAHRSEIINTSPDGGGCIGTTVLRANEIGVVSGNGTTTGQTSAGRFIGQFDAVRRRYSSRPILETTVVTIPPPLGGWADNSVYSIVPSALNIYGWQPSNWSSQAPASARILDILDARWAWLSNAPPTMTTAQWANLKHIDASPFITRVTGVGAESNVPVSITLGTGVTALGLVTETLCITLLIAYPGANGLSHTPVADFGSKSFAFTTAAPPSTGVAGFSSFANTTIDAPHREACVEYRTITRKVALSIPATTLPLVVPLPERVQSVSVVRFLTSFSAATQAMAPTVSIATIPQPAPVDEFPVFTVLDSGRAIRLPGGNPLGFKLAVEYIGLRPMSPTGHQIVVYYQAAAPQTGRSGLLGTGLALKPRLAAQQVWALSLGASSQTEAYPLPLAYVQSGGLSNGMLETYWSGLPEICSAGVGVSSGQLQLPVLVPFVGTNDTMTLSRALTDVDSEGRTYFTTGTVRGYRPNAFAGGLKWPAVHKNVYPMLVEIAADCPLGFRGQLLLLLLVRVSGLDDINGVALDGTGTTTAGVFRLKLLNKPQG